MKDKEFDAVRMMREIRDELSRRYNEDPSAERRELQEIRKKYEIKGVKMVESTSDDGVYLDSCFCHSARIHAGGWSQDVLGAVDATTF